MTDSSSFNWFTWIWTKWPHFLLSHIGLINGSVDRYNSNCYHPSLSDAIRVLGDEIIHSLKEIKTTIWMIELTICVAHPTRCRLKWTGHFFDRQNKTKQLIKRQINMFHMQQKQSHIHWDAKWCQIGEKVEEIQWYFQWIVHILWMNKKISGHSEWASKRASARTFPAA